MSKRHPVTFRELLASSGPGSCPGVEQSLSVDVDSFCLRQKVATESICHSLYGLKLKANVTTELFNSVKPAGV